MSNFYSSDPSPDDSSYRPSQTGWPSVWISKKEPLPNTCITCGMFTDQRRAAKVFTNETQYVAQKQSSGVEALGCLLHLLGPIGFVLSLALKGSQKEETVEQVVKVKSKIKLPVCRLCAGQEMPAPEQGNSTSGRYAFQVHPRFASELEQIRKQAEGL